MDLHTRLNQWKGEKVCAQMGCEIDQERGTLSHIGLDYIEFEDETIIPFHAIRRIYPI